MRLSLLSSVIFAVVSAAVAADTSPTWTQLSLSTCRVDEFLASRPQCDGRGVVIAVLDTGVDPSIPGLTTASDGQVKVVELRDFTGQGDIELHRVYVDGETEQLVDHDDAGVPIRYALPGDLPSENGEERRYWMGYLDEAKFVNSDVPDLNDNGATDDRFPICVTALSGDGDDQAICLVDTNIDRSFADEKPLRNYHLAFDTFTLHRRAPESQIVPTTFSLNVYLRQTKVVVSYDDGAHGTHVAGIAAGHRINNQDGFHGVAPGAKVMGLKIGQNAIGGPSTTESIKGALEFAARYAREHQVPVVCNLSYGVESVIERQSDIDRFVDELLLKNPYLVFCSSAGNEGPGLSTVGTPAAADRCISVAALLAPDTARDVMGTSIDEAVVTVFSSRGGELDKPDIATPGWSTSTVPRWVRRGDFWAGTSMASPYAAGLCALLLSDAQARHPSVQVRAADVRRALTLSSRPLPGTTFHDGGFGVPDLVKAAEILERLVAAAKDDPVVGYEVSTPCPHGPDGSAPAAYWRGTWFPTDRRQAFTVKPVFGPLADAAARTAFTRRFQLRTNTPWIKLTQEQVYLRSEQSATVQVEYDASRLTAPGVYTGEVEAVHDGLTAFRLLNTVIVPYRFNADEDFSRSFKGQSATGWTPKRYFLAVPPGASAMLVTLAAPEGEDSKASIERIYGPDGQRFRVRARKLDTQAGRRRVEATFSDELLPGVWEVPVVANRPDRVWPFEMDVRFFGLDAQPPRVVDADALPSGEITVTNQFERPLPTTAHGAVEGFRLHKDAEFKGLKDELSYSIDLDEHCDRIRLKLVMTPEAYATTTDIGVIVEDPSGHAILSDAFSNRTFEASVAAGGAESVKVFIRAGFAVADDQRQTPITVNIDRLLVESVPVRVTQGPSSNIEFYPGVPTKLEYKVDGELPDAPEGTQPVGYLGFKDRASGAEALHVPIEISPE